MKRKTLVKGFDYENGVPCEYTAEMWDGIRHHVFAHGGFVRKCYGEEWLFNKAHKWLYEIYWNPREPYIGRMGTAPDVLLNKMR
jgi:hypothetical protein